MDINELTIGQAKELASLFSGGAEDAISTNIGKHCVVRTYSAGVHIGTVAKKSGTNVLLTDARRIFKWGGAFTLSELSQNGVDPKESRISVAVPTIELTQVIEIIPTSAAARESFDITNE